MKLYGKKALAFMLALMMVLPMLGTAAMAATYDYDVDLEWDLAYTDDPDEDWVYLDDLIEELLEEEYYRYDVDIDEVEILTDDSELKYGTLGSRDRYTADLLDADDEAELYEKNYLAEVDIEYEAWDTENESYGGVLELYITAYELALEYDLEGQTEFYLGEALAADLDDIIAADEVLDYVWLTEDKDNDCGTLYSDDDYEDFDEDEKYWYDPTDADDYDLEELYFEPDGSEGEFILEYTAVTADDEEYEGTITLKCGGALLIKTSIDGDEYYTFDFNDFQDAVDEWDDEYTLAYIDNVKLSDKTDGYLYYEYDEDARKNTAISGTEEYYADEDEDDLMEEISFVPAKGTKGKVTITFDARVEKSATRYKNVPGVLEISVDKAADINIAAKVGKTVEIDADLFQEYLEEDLDSTRYDVDHVVITGAPRTKSEGYLYCDDEKMDGRGSLTFHADPGRNDYDLYALEYVAGTEGGTYTATFTVYYYDRTTKKASTEGTINFLVDEGPTTTEDVLYMSANAAKPMSFAEYDSSVIRAGDNQNMIVVFAAMPKSGTLYYKYGTAQQKEITATDRFITGLGQNLTGNKLADVSYVPSYSSYKVMYSDSFGMIAASAEADQVEITATVNVSPNTVSRFYDVTDVKYIDSVEFLANTGITTGTGANTFSPKAQLARAQFVTFLWRAAGQPAPKSTVNPFKDVSATDPKYGYAYNAILWAAEQGITTGVGGGKFGTGDPVTHEQLLTFLHRYAGKPAGYAATVPFTDFASASTYAQTPIKWAYGQQILMAADGLLLQPTAYANRDTMALWLHRMLTK